MSTEIYQISATDAILRIKKLIAQNQGDKGRLQYIMESLQKGKKLFHSDQKYLDKKISATVIPSHQTKPSEHEEKLDKVKKLISLNFGDPERLRYMFQRLEKNKGLYHSDEKYLDLKTEQIIKYRQRKKFTQPTKSIFLGQTKIKNKNFVESISEEIENEKSVESVSKNTLSAPKKGMDLSSTALENSEFYGKADSYLRYDVEIENERKKISELKLENNQIKIQRDELSQLIAYRQEYELKINHETNIIESENKLAQNEIKDKDKLVEELISNQSKIIQIRTEREVLVDQVKAFKFNSEKELEQKQKELEDLKIFLVQHMAKQEYTKLDSDNRMIEENSDQLKKTNLKKSLGSKIGLSLLAIGLILGVSAVIIKPVEFWVCDLLEILNITLFSFC